MFSQWGKRGRERVVRTMFSGNGEHPTNQSGVAATCATRCIPVRVCDHIRFSRSPSCLVLHFRDGSHLIRDGNHFGLNYQRRPLHATNVYTADARRAAGASANAVHRIYRRTPQPSCSTSVKSPTAMMPSLNQQTSGRTSKTPSQHAQQNV